MSRPKGSKDKQPRVRTGNHKSITCTCSVCGNLYTLKKTPGTETICKKCRIEKIKRIFSKIIRDTI